MPAPATHGPVVLDDERLVRPHKGKGRKTALTPAVRDAICEQLTAGSTLKNAANMAGIHETTLHDWRSRGRQAEADGKRDVYLEFLDRTTIALAAGKNRLIGCIAHAAEEQWTAAAWLLERKFPEEFSLKVNDIVANQLNKFVDRMRARLPPELYAKVIDAMTDDSPPSGSSPSP